MNYNKKSIEDIEVAGKRVLCRCDFNVPTKNGVITSDKRIVAAMPTIKYLVDNGAKVILCSHMGKPKGEWKPELSLQVVAERLSQLLGQQVIMAADVAGEDAKAKASDTLSGEDVFKLYDTFGFPPDLTREIAAESGLGVCEEEFKALMDEQKNRARAARGNISGWSDSSKDLIAHLPQTVFDGYKKDTVRAKVLSIISENEAVDAASEGECSVIFDKTVFYGEGGGQVGDTGSIASKSFFATVTDTKKTGGIYIHNLKIENGEIKVGDTLTLKIDTARRAAIKRNHSACHLLQAALREVLGSHVEQAGSYVDDARVRFDFSHLSALTHDEISRVEALVNEKILLAEECNTTVTDPEKAKKMGAMALFGEKYGDKVRVVSIGSSSMELCGGTHVSSTGEIGLFKIISESSVAAGVRRIEGTTGLGVLALLAERDGLIHEAARELKAPNPNNIAKRAAALQGEIKEMKRELDSANSRLAEIRTESLLSDLKTIGKFRVVCAKLDMRADQVRSLADTVKAKYEDGVAVFAAVDGGKLNFVVSAGSAAVKAGAHAGKIAGAVAEICDGKGGGRPDSAMSGGKDVSRVAEALAHAEKLLSEI